MVELITVLAYALTLGIPLLILGFGSMINESRGSQLLALINFISLLTYFNYTGDIAGWVTALFLAVLSFIFVFMYKSVLGGTE